MLVLKKVYYDECDTVHLKLYDTNTEDIIDTTNTNVEAFGIIDGNYIEISDLSWRLLDLIDAPKVQKPNGIVFNCPNMLYPLDDNMIFWFINGLGYVTILELYRYVFQKPLRFTDDMDVFVVSLSNIAYRLDINIRVIHFMEKLLC